LKPPRSGELERCWGPSQERHGIVLEGARGIVPTFPQGGPSFAQAHGTGGHTFRLRSRVHQIPRDPLRWTACDERLKTAALVHLLWRFQHSYQHSETALPCAIRKEEAGVALDLHPERDLCIAFLQSFSHCHDVSALCRPFHPRSPSCFHYHVDVYPSAVLAFSALLFLAERDRPDNHVLIFACLWLWSLYTPLQVFWSCAIHTRLEVHSGT
jgi:hypothetical protein